MEQYAGRSVFKEVAFGKAFVIQKRELVIDETQAENSAVEWERFLLAKKQADAELEALFETTRKEIGEDDAMIIDVQRMIMDDGDFNESVERYIKEDARKAAYAVSSAGREFFELFSSLDDPYMKARAPDIASVSQMITDILMGVNREISLSYPAVIIADDLSPSETLQLDKSLIRAFVIRRGSANSHTAILARTLKIPTLVQTKIPLDSAMNGRDAAVDGHEGKLYLEPDTSVKTVLEERQKKNRENERLLEALRGLPTVTKDGRKIELYANIGSVEDMETARSQDAEGIGLFRSEFLYLGRNELPSEDEQFAVYSAVAKGMDGRRVIIRTMDIGADKKAEYLNLKEEENPALGCRAIRLCLQRPEMFKTQLRALYRAAVFGKIAIMFPMIASLWELRKCKELAAEAREELAVRGIKAGDAEIGVMIETPAAALISADLAAETDFFSVGTNDLTQYTLAADRQNEALERFADPHHPAVLRLLQITADSAKSAGIRAGICGELAADGELTETFINMGYHELSVSPAFILGIRKRIREMDLA
jgi:phosphotransferase system enzyme I (PtsI)